MILNVREYFLNELENALFLVIVCRNKAHRIQNK